MGDRTIARRYAKAFLDVAVEHNAVVALAEDLQKLVTAGHGNGGELFTALSNPAFTIEERKAVLGSIVQRIGVHAMTRNLLQLLLDNGRFALVPEVAEMFGLMSDEQRNRIRVVVETATPMAPELEYDVRKSLERITGKSVVIDSRVNPALIGGMIARVGSKVYDASVRARLDDSRNRLIFSQAPAEA